MYSRSVLLSLAEEKDQQRLTLLLLVAKEAI
jgi:hypothetical protein